MAKSLTEKFLGAPEKQPTPDKLEVATVVVEAVRAASRDEAERHELAAQRIAEYGGDPTRCLVEAYNAWMRAGDFERSKAVALTIPNPKEPPAASKGDAQAQPQPVR